MAQNFDALSNRRKRHYINLEADKLLQNASQLCTSTKTAETREESQPPFSQRRLSENVDKFSEEIDETDPGCTCSECQSLVPVALDEIEDDFYEEDHYYDSNVEAIFNLISSADEGEGLSDLYFSAESENESMPTNDQESISSISCPNIVSTLKNELAKWKTTYYISLAALTALLLILRTHGHENDLPKDARTLLQTPKNTFQFIEKMDDGKYGHFGVAYGIETIIKCNYNFFKTQKFIVLRLNIHVDGLPLSKSSSKQFCTIQGCAISPIEHPPFLIGVFYGTGKPKDCNKYLRRFVEDFKYLEDNVILVMGLSIRVYINAIIGDAPALAFIKNIKYFNGHYGCSKCTQKGKSILRRMTFRSTKSPLRSDHTFRHRTQPDHHHGSTILEQLKIDMIVQFPVDYMHCACLGVMKKLLRIWTRGVAALRLSSDDIIILSNMLTGAVKLYIPHEFARKPRTLVEIQFWKATEFRLFLMYIGMVVMRYFLDSEKYRHFLKFSIALRLLCDQDTYLTENNYAEKLLKQFVEECTNLYGSHIVTYTFHNLIHLPADAMQFGTLDKFSAFIFENAMQKYKRQIFPNDSSLEQLLNRTIEEYTHATESISQTSYPILNFTKNRRNQNLKSVEFNGFTVSTEMKDNVYLFQSNLLGLVEDLLFRNESVVIKIRLFKKCQPLFSGPCDSMKLGISVVNTGPNNLQSMKEVPITTIKRKMVKIPMFNPADLSTPLENEFAVIPLLHTTRES